MKTRVLATTLAAEDIDHAFYTREDLELMILCIQEYQARNQENIEVIGDVERAYKQRHMDLFRQEIMR
jgi:hypothetical protein